MNCPVPVPTVVENWITALLPLPSFPITTYTLPAVESTIGASSRRLLPSPEVPVPWHATVAGRRWRSNHRGHTRVAVEDPSAFGGCAHRCQPPAADRGSGPVGRRHENVPARAVENRTAQNRGCHLDRPGSWSCDHGFCRRSRKHSGELVEIAGVVTHVKRIGTGRIVIIRRGIRIDRGGIQGCGRMKRDGRHARCAAASIAPHRGASENHRRCAAGLGGGSAPFQHHQRRNPSLRLHERQLVERRGKKSPKC